MCPQIALLPKTSLWLVFLIHLPSICLTRHFLRDRIQKRNIIITNNSRDSLYMMHPTYFALNKKGFTYMEIIVATMIIILVGVGMYRINSFFLNNSTDNRRITIANQFSKYVASIVNTNPVPEDFSIVPNQAFYIEAFPDSFQYTIDPNKKTGNLGFF